MRAVFELLFAAVVAGQHSNEVVLRDRLTPTGVVETVTGKCGSLRYSIQLQHDGSRNVLSITANGRPVSPPETAKVMEAVTRGYFMYEPKIAECFRDRPNARFRLLTGGPNDGGKPIWLSFEVSPEGKVSAIRQD
jgi:hypothetical protein